MTARAEELLETPVLVPGTPHPGFTAVITDGTAIAASGWQGIETAGLGDGARTILPMAALVSDRTVRRVRLIGRDHETTLDAMVIDLLRTPIDASGTAFRHGVADVGAGGSVAAQVSAMRMIPASATVDWFPGPRSARRNGHIGIARDGAVWETWRPAGTSSPGRRAIHETEIAALATLTDEVRSQPSTSERNHR